MDQIIVTVAGQVRGTNAQTGFGFTADEGTLTNMWGLQPGTALLSWVQAGLDTRVILPLAALTLEIGGHTFYGLCEEAVQVTSHDGRTLTQRFLDSRLLLQYDLIYAQFNRRDARMVSGQYRTRYQHLLPANYNARAYTFSDAPYSARQILDFCFGAVTVESPWVRSYHSALNQPVYDVDCDTGRKLGTLVSELSARCGTTFTLQGGRYRLVWVVKGVGGVPAFPANSSARRVGLAVSENPTRLRILGDRNQYQVLNVPMIPDWQPAYEPWALNFDDFADDLFRYEKTEAAFGSIPAATRYNAIAGDTTQHVGRQLAQARANVITVGEYAALREARTIGTGAAWRDPRRAQGQSRMQMPVVTYCRMLVYRAFRPPTAFSFQNYQGQWMPLAGMDLLDHALTDLTHDPVSGTMTAIVGGRQMPGNGYAVVQGYGVSLEGLRLLHPETFDLSPWRLQQNLWQAMPYQLDDSGEDGKFIVFDAPVIVSADLLVKPVIGAVEQAYPILKARPTITVPAVRAALVVAGERFSYVTGEGTRDEVENVAGLAGQFLVADGLTELAYANGETASTKAEALAATLLNRQFLVTAGGYTVQGSNATALTSVIDRVTVTLNAASGLTEAVDFANARARNVGPRGSVQVELPSELERRAQLQPLFAGEAEQREAARQFQLQASALRNTPGLARLLDTLHANSGLDAPPATLFFHPGQVTTAGG